MPLNTIHLRRTVDTLEQAILHLQALPVERPDAASVSRDTKPGSSVTADGVLAGGSRLVGRMGAGA